MAPPGDYSAEKAAQIERDLAAAKKAYIDLGAAAVNFGNISSDVADKELINAKNLAQQNADRAAAMRSALEQWQRSVLRSWQGEDYHANVR